MSKKDEFINGNGVSIEVQELSSSQKLVVIATAPSIQPMYISNTPQQANHPVLLACYIIDMDDYIYNDISEARAAGEKVSFNSADNMFEMVLEEK